MRPNILTLALDFIVDIKNSVCIKIMSEKYIVVKVYLFNPELWELNCLDCFFGKHVRMNCGRSLWVRINGLEWFMLGRQCELSERALDLPTI